MSDCLALSLRVNLLQVESVTKSRGSKRHYRVSGMLRMRVLATALATFFLPRSWKPRVLRWLGHRVHESVRIGPSLLLVPKLFLEEAASIGWLNFIQCRRLVLRPKSQVQHLNVVAGPFSVWLLERGVIGKRNVIRRAQPEIAHPSLLRLGVLSKLTVNHEIDCTESILIGNYSVVAGKGSQIWTHGFVHTADVASRAIVCGKVRIGSNVYIGSHSCINGGVTIADEVTTGSQSSIAVSLIEPGVYVNQPLRHIASTAEERLSRIRFVPDVPGNPFYWKDGGGPIPVAAVPRPRRVEVLGKGERAQPEGAAEGRARVADAVSSSSEQH